MRRGHNTMHEPNLKKTPNDMCSGIKSMLLYATNKFDVVPYRKNALTSIQIQCGKLGPD